MSMRLSLNPIRHFHHSLRTIFHSKRHPVVSIASFQPNHSAAAMFSRVTQPRNIPTTPALKLWIEFDPADRQKSKKEAKNYDPAPQKYDPFNDACWAPRDRVPYLALARTLKSIENESSRLKMIDILSNYFQSVICLTPEDLSKSIYLILNQLAPAYEGIELGLGESILIKAISQATGRRPQDIKNELIRIGDLGLVSETSRVNQGVLMRPAPLTVRGVFDKLHTIAKLTGQSTRDKKVQEIQSMLVSCRDCEARYIARSLLGKLRIGLAEQSLLTALARAVVSLTYVIKGKNVDKEDDKFKARLEDAITSIKTAYNCLPNYDKVIATLLEHGPENLEDLCQSIISVPLKPMLAQPAISIEQLFETFGEKKFTCEYKYDGERAQIHRTQEGKTYIFSRNQENTAQKYPDVLKEIGDYMKPETKAFILDCECVAWDAEEKRILPFQVLSTRKRKSAEDDEIKVKVCLFAFDLLHINERSLLKETLMERRKILHDSFVEIPGRFMFASSRDVDNADDIKSFLDESLVGQCEGLMVKSLDSTYELAKRSQHWLKLKKDYVKGMSDSLDVVVMGAYWGQGKRTGNYGGFLVGCYDDENEQFQALCKTGTGFTDADLAMLTQLMKEHQIDKPKPYYEYGNKDLPDVWLDAAKVIEIKCADFTLSPVYRVAYDVLDKDKGISLRFPRFLRVRDDKKPEDATSSSQVVHMYNCQEIFKKNDNKVVKDVE
ncbi:DNA ligase 1, partial [Fragariocoptes setiger]